jgi:putative hydrolase of the HAD superfamily
MIKAYFFDLGETLAEFRDRTKFWEQLSAEQDEALMTTPDFDSVDLGDKRDFIYGEMAAVQFSLYPDSERVIRQLKGRYSVGLVSNINCITCSLIRERLPEFLSYFDVLAFSCEVGARKPNPAMFRYALNQLNQNGSTITPEEVVMIGDKDITPALQLGMQARLIDRSRQNLEDVI